MHRHYALRLLAVLATLTGVVLLPLAGAASGQELPCVKALGWNIICV